MKLSRDFLINEIQVCHMKKKQVFNCFTRCFRMRPRCYDNNGCGVICAMSNRVLNTCSNCSSLKLKISLLLLILLT